MPVGNAASRRERQRQELREGILDAARELFAREGVEQISMRRLAEAVGYSPGTLYLHFASKEDLLRCLVDQAFGTLLAMLQASRASTSLATLRAGLRAYVAFGLAHPRQYQFAFVLQAPPASGAYEPHEAFQYLRQCVRDCIRSGEFRGVDPETAAQILWAGVHGLTSLFIARPAFPWVERSRLVEATLETLIDGFAGPKENPA